MIRAMIRCWAATVAGSLTGVVVAALICWVWLATVDGHSLDW